MSRAPRPIGIALITALKQAGFIVVPVRGGHHFMPNDEGRATVVPVHAGDTIGPGLLHRILRDCKLTMQTL